jgi:hypothetical protein
VKCQCGVRERLCAGSGQVKSSQVRSSPSPVPFQFQFQFRSQSQSQSQKETEGAGHSAGFMPFDRLEGMWPGRERLSLCNAATGNGRSLRCGRQRRQRGGLAVGCWVWAAGCWLLATRCWLLASLGISLLPTGHGPGPGPSLTHSQHPACLEHPRATCQACAAAVQVAGPFKAASVPSAATDDHWFDDGFACVSGGVLAFQGAYTPEVLGLASSHSLASPPPPPRITRRLFA